MKKRKIPEYFGNITSEELETITRATESFDGMVIDFQKRPRTDSEEKEDKA